MEPRVRTEGEEQPTDASGTGLRRRPWALLRAALVSLENRDYRILWLGVTGHSVTLWMETIARNWLVWELTGSGLALGLVNFWRNIPILFLAIPAGAVADRVNRRVILLVTQTVILGVYFALAALLILDRLEIIHVYALFFLRGVAITFNQPPRQTLIAAYVNRSHLANAVALQQASFNGMRLIGPALAGVLFAVVGAMWVFIIIAWIDLFVILMFLLLQEPERAPSTGPPRAALGTMWEGLVYVAHHRLALLLLVLGLVVLFFGHAHDVLLPIFADLTFGLGAGGYGVFVSAIGLGALFGPIAIAIAGDFRWKGAVVIGTMLLLGIGLILFAYTPWLSVALVIIGLTGFVDSVYRVLTNTLLLSQTDPAFHGRVMSLLLMDRGFVPIGGLIAGGLADIGGVSLALALMAVILIASVLLLTALQPRFLRAS